MLSARVHIVMPQYLNFIQPGIHVVLQYLDVIQPGENDDVL